MKKIFTLFSIFTLGTAAFSQVVFESDLSTWAAGDPTDWMGSKSNIAGADVIEVTVGSTYGASDAQLVNATATHKRFTTQPVSVTAGLAYEIKFWVKGQGQIRTGLFDDHTPTSSFGYTPYNSYITVNSATPVEYTQSITALGTNTNAEFILSVLNTVGPGHLIVDSVSITAGTPPPPTVTSIYDIQYTTASPANSPLEGQIVTTSGIVTGKIVNGPDAGAYFIQDGAGGWNGIYVYDTDAVVAIGDSVDVTGEVDEFNLVTEIKNITAYTVVTPSNPLPASTTATTSNANSEQYEGVLVTVASAQCTNTTEGFGMWAINDNSGVIKCDDDIFAYHLTAVVGNWYMVTGIGHYSFSEAKILPRSLSDITITGTAGIEENNTFTIYPNPANSVVILNVQADAVVRIYSTTGTLVYEAIGETTIDVSNFAAGIYQVTVLQNETTSTQKLSVQ
jgi:hypothetical protein